MTDPVVVVDRDEIVAILSSARVAPPGHAGPGATMALRAAMARFAGPDVHGRRRRAVEDVIDSLAGIDVGALARRATVDRLRPTTADALVAVRAAPVATLLAALGVIPLDQVGRANAVIADVEAVAAVIGRGSPITARAEAAAERLLALVAPHPGDPVAVVSVLYQCLDATAAMIATRLHARGRASGAETSVVDEPVPSVPFTVRTVIDEVQIGDRRFLSGAVITLAIGSAGLHFGAGPHACPGSELALALVEAVVRAVEEHDAIDVGRVALDEAGRPTSLPLRGLRT